MSTVQRPPRNDAPRPKNPVTSEILDRQPPFNLEAETGVLGSIMLNPDVCDDVTMLR
jgi:replicative DNA helicase